MKHKLRSLLGLNSLFTFGPKELAWYLWLSYPLMLISAFNFLSDPTVKYAVIYAVTALASWEFHGGFTHQVNKCILNNPNVVPYFDKIYHLACRDRKLLTSSEVRIFIDVLKWIPRTPAFTFEDFMCKYKLDEFKYTTLGGSKGNIWLGKLDSRIANGSLVDRAAVYYFYLYLGSMAVEFGMSRSNDIIKRAITLHSLHWDN